MTGGGDTVVVPTADEDASLRAMIRAELDRQHARPVARRTLELLAEASAEPTEGEPGYRIVDRSGETRLRPVSPEQAKKGMVPDIALTLSDLVGELRERHPDLFGTPPEPEPESPPEPQVTLQNRVAHVRAAGARFVETQSTLAKTLATQSAERGRALASAAGETVETWRSRIDARVNTQGEAASVADAGRPSDATVTARAPRDWRRLANDAAVRFKARALRRDDRADDTAVPRREDASPASVSPIATGRSRTLALGAAGVAVLGVLLAVFLTPGRRAGDEPQQAQVPAQQRTEASPPTQPQTQPPPPADTASKPAQPPASAATPLGPPADLEEQPDEAPAQAPNEVAGVPEVIDTATLRINGKVVRLFGVEWVRGGQADELTKYLARRPVSCQPAPGSSAYLCSVNGRDLSEVVLFNGGGRASPEAGPELVAAEDHARSERLGVWKR